MYVIDIIIPQRSTQWKKELLTQIYVEQMWTWCSGVMENKTETKMKKNKKKRK